MNVLVTSASRKVSLIRAFQDALSKEGGGRVIAVDITPAAAALYVADEHYLVPRSDDPRFVPTMVTLCRERDVRIIIPTRDEELPLFAEHKDVFAKAEVVVHAPGLAAVELCQDKLRFARFCVERRLGTPKTYETPDDAPFPLFVKPRKGKGSRGAFLVRSSQELQAAWAALGSDAIAQEYLHAPEYTIDLFADFGGRVISVAPRQRLLVFGGESFVGVTVRNPILRDGAIRLAGELDLVGHNTIQCFLHEGSVKFIEVNPRYGGGAALGFAAGALTPWFLVRLVKGETLEPRLDEFKEGLYMLRYTEDLFLDSSTLSTRTYPG